MLCRRIVLPALLAAGLAALTPSAAKAQLYSCNPFPLFWPVCAAAAVVGTVGYVVTAPFRAVTYPYYYRPYPYYYPAPYAAAPAYHYPAPYYR